MFLHLKMFRRAHQTLRLPDGRTLGFAEFGAPHGRPLLYFHGYPSSRLEPTPIEALLTRQNVRLLALDRPGFGLSSPQPNRRIVDWPDDVRFFAKSMHLDKVPVMGLSGGGPYALATAYAAPDLVRSVGLFASGPPWVAGAHYMTKTRRVARFLAVNSPTTLSAILTGVVGATKWTLGRNWVKKTLDRRLGSEGQVDELVRTLLAEPFTQGSAAAVEEARLLSEDDWGFDFAHVKPHVLIWHGKKDVNSPIEAMRYLADRIPSCELRESDDSHYTMARHMETAVAELVD